MADSAPGTSTRPPKRERLVDGARELLYEQGVQRTTLAQIAERADVPVGNVYYYYKTRDELVQAVIESRIVRIRQVLGDLDRRSTPTARLKALAATWIDVASEVTEHGCPVGSLACELAKDNDAVSAHAAGMIREILEWIERQFRELGRRDAPALAVTMLGAIQGAALLANALRDEDLLDQEIRRIRRWVDALA
jgi:TetR/AcrR family transcriptional regulator, transcriptional repressor for nem operon